jgi:hypothetical protein
MRVPRMTTRRWMIAVALTAVLSGGLDLYRRSVDLAALAEMHDLMARKSWTRGSLVGPRGAIGHVEYPTPLTDHHTRLRDKYRRAAARPWLPVAPDPPPLE